MDQNENMNQYFVSGKNKLFEGLVEKVEQEN